MKRLKQFVREEKKILLSLIGATLAGILASLYLSVFWNPEVQFWAEVMEDKDTEIAEIKEPKIVVIGGSSCTFSIDPEIIEANTGLRSYNYGGSVMMGMDYIFSRVKKHLKRGDFLVVAFEPESLDGSHDYQLGRRLIVNEGDYSLGGSLSKKGAMPWISALRPGIRNVVVNAGRSATGGNKYTYSIEEDRRSGGRFEIRNVEYRIPLSRLVGSLKLSDESIELIWRIRKYCENEGIDFGYSLPWLASHPDIVEDQVEERRRFLKEVSKIIPVLKDGSRAGVRSGMEGFSDTCYHMTGKLSRVRSTALAEGINQHLQKQ